MLSQNMTLNTLDPRSMNGLKQWAKSGVNSDEALRAASKQVEAMFLQMMLKSMRSAALAEGVFDNEQTKMLQEMHDQQLASDVAQKKGVGLAEALFRQLGGGRDKSVEPTPAVAESAKNVEKINKAIEVAKKVVKQVPEHVREFVTNVWPHAHAASKATGIPAHFMVAQAALETGWGTKQLKNADGTPSNNLFNIKAGANWEGATTAQKQVVEHEGGTWKKQRAEFRSYASLGEAFADYAKFLANNPRYAGVLGKDNPAEFAKGLQQAGYATDPQYADKLMRIIGGSTLKNALVAAA